MPLPQVRPQTRKRVEREWMEKEHPSLFVHEVSTRLEAGENPRIVEFLSDVLRLFQDRDWILNAVVFGFAVYRMLELEQGCPLPVVSDEVGAPIQEEFLRNPGEYLARHLSDLLFEKNRQIALASSTFAGDYVLLDMMEEAQMVASIGIIVYQFLEGQLEADELKRLMQ